MGNLRLNRAETTTWMSEIPEGFRTSLGYLQGAPQMLVFFELSCETINFLCWPWL